MLTQNTTLLAALEGLEQALALKSGSREEQSNRLERSLDVLEGAVQREVDMLQATKGRIVDVNRPRIPSPTVERRTNRLRQELEQFTTEIRGLRTRLRGDRVPEGMDNNPSTLAGALSVAPEAGGLADWGVLLERARQLAHALEHFEDEEAELIFDSVNTDIGAGD